MKTEYQMTNDEILNEYGITKLNSNSIGQKPVFGEIQTFQTPICEIYVHQLPAGAQLPKDMHYLARMFFVIRGSVQMHDRARYQSKPITSLQSTLIHPYIECQVLNESQEEAWVIEFRFFTMEALPAPSVRTVTPWQHPFVENAQRFQVPDWSIQICSVAPYEVCSLDAMECYGHVLTVDQGSGIAAFQSRVDCGVVDGMQSGKYVFVVDGNQELW